MYRTTPKRKGTQKRANERRTAKRTAFRAPFFPFFRPRVVFFPLFSARLRMLPSPGEYFGPLGFRLSPPRYSGVMQDTWFFRFRTTHKAISSWFTLQRALRDPRLEHPFVRKSLPNPLQNIRVPVRTYASCNALSRSVYAHHRPRLWGGTGTSHDSSPLPCKVTNEMPFGSYSPSQYRPKQPLMHQNGSKCTEIRRNTRK